MMTRSRKKTPIFGMACHNGMKWYKRYKHGQERARAKDAIHHGQYELAEDELAPWNEWDSPRDGQRYWYAPDNEHWKKSMRK